MSTAREEADRIIGRLPLTATQRMFLRKAIETAILAAERRALEKAAKVADDFRDVMLNTDLQSEPLLWLDGAEHAARDVAVAIRALAGEEET
jgi:hypothetical protein